MTEPAVPAVPEVPAVSTVPVEARRYQGHRAGIVTRVVANVIDVGVVCVVLAGGYLGWVSFRFLRDPRGFTFPPLPSLVTLMLIGLWIQVVYFTVSWTTTGRTYGDHVMGLRVVNLKGRRMHLWGAVVRAAGCAIFPIGLFWIVVSNGNRSIQDVALRTSVIYDWTARSNRSLANRS